MASTDRARWDETYRARSDDLGPPELPSRFAEHAELLAAAGTALEIACGAGRTAVWLAEQGVQVTAYDISPVAVAQARELATERRVQDGCRFEVADFDDGLPDGDAVDVVVCNLFRDERLDQPIIDRLRPGGVLAMAALSEVGAEPGRFRVAPGALPQAFASLEEVASDEGDGVAWLIARKPD